MKLPKGLLLFGPPGCGKTEIAKTLDAEGGLHFIALSTSDCKQMSLGWSADRLAKVFKEARTNQPSLIWTDELDAVCPVRGAYHDAVSQEFTAQLLQELEGIASDSDAIFLMAAIAKIGELPPNDYGAGVGPREYLKLTSELKPMLVLVSKTR